MHMSMEMYKNCFAIIFSFFLVSCASVPSIIFEGKEVRNLFMQAQKQESVKNYSEAAKTYSYIAKNFPATINYPTAVQKAAMLHSHPENPDINLKKSLYCPYCKTSQKKKLSVIKSL